MTIDGSSLLIADKVMEDIHKMFSPEKRENLPMRYRFIDIYERFCGVYILCIHYQDGRKSKIELRPMNITAQNRIIPALEFAITEYYKDDVDIEILPIPDPGKLIFSLHATTDREMIPVDTMWYED